MLTVAITLIAKKPQQRKPQKKRAVLVPRLQKVALTYVWITAPIPIRIQKILVALAMIIVKILKARASINIAKKPQQQKPPTQLAAPVMTTQKALLPLAMLIIVSKIQTKPHKILAGLARTHL
jgi:hypothetical protein